MKRRFFISLTLITALSCPLSLGRSEEVLDKVAAVVNDDVITQSELDQLLIPLYEQYRTLFSGQELLMKMNEARQSLMSQMIEDKLVYQEAKRLKVEVTEEEVNARMTEFRERFPKEIDFEKLVADQGLTIAKLRERYRQQIASRKLQQFEIQQKIVVTPKEMQDYYASHLDRFSEKEGVKARTITIRKGEEAVKTKQPDPIAKAKAEEILRKFYGGSSFEELAQEFSEDTKAADGGNLGVIIRGDLLTSLDQALFNLKEGEISPILETEMGYHLFKVEEKIKPSSKSLEEVRQEINDLIYRQKSRKRFKEWMEDLKKNAYISIR